jgi:hypothetical protein
VDEARREWVPVDELAALLAEEYDGWEEADLKELEDGESQITDEAWGRVCTHKERWLRGLVAQGKLPGRGKGRHLKVMMGALDDLLGRKTDAFPDDYYSYRVLPDSDADEAGQERLDLRRLQDVLDWRPLYAEPNADFPDMPTRFIEALR